MLFFCNFFFFDFTFFLLFDKLFSLWKFESFATHNYFEKKGFLIFLFCKIMAEVNNGSEGKMQDEKRVRSKIFFIMLLMRDGFNSLFLPRLDL